MNNTKETQMADSTLKALDSISNDFLAICAAINKNYPKYCLTRLNRIKLGSRSKILNQIYIKGEQILTLLIESILKKQTVLAASLICNGVNFNIRGRVKILSVIFNEASPVFCAAIRGNISILKHLIEKGANINEYTRCNSSPLIAACYRDSLECVEYLIKNRADMNVFNIYGSSCLTVACRNGYESIVKCLLSNGADIDAQNKFGYTAMHYAAKQNHINIIKLLISKGAKQLKDIQSMTPILAAAEETRCDIVNYLANLNLTQENIDAYELLGASFLNNKENYNFEKGFSALLTAMEMRSKHKIQKQPHKKIAAYNNQIECETVQDLMNLRNFPEALHYESLIIRERFFGENKPNKLLPPIMYRGACYADVEHYESCLKLFCHAIQISRNNTFSGPVDLLQFIKVFSKMIKSEINIELSYLIYALTYTIDEYKHSKNKIVEGMNAILKKKMYRKIYTNMRLIMSLIIIISITLEKECNLEHPLRKNILAIIRELNMMNLRYANNMTLLHMSIKYNVELDDHITTIVWFPHYLSMKLLLTCGADVNALDDDRNTPLHYIIKFFMECPFMPHDIDFNTKSVMEELLNAGAHTDIVNKKGMSPHNTNITSMYPSIKNSPRNLTCLAATVIKHILQKEYFHDKCPQSLLDFIDLH